MQTDHEKMLALALARRTDDVNRYNRMIIELINKAAMPFTEEEDKKKLMDSAIELSIVRNKMMEACTVQFEKGE